jgi:hypothetical protein
VCDDEVGENEATIVCQASRAISLSRPAPQLVPCRTLRIISFSLRNPTLLLYCLGRLSLLPRLLRLLCRLPHPSVSFARCSSAPSTATIPLPSAPANTAKLSSTLLQPTSGLSFAGDTNRPPNQRRHSERAASSMDTKAARRRRSSSLMYTEPPESLEHISDQAALPNLNSEWVNAKG